MQPTNRVISIPTKIYLKKFIEFVIGTDVIIPGDHPIQRFLYILLEKKDFQYNFKKQHRDFNAKLDLKLSFFTLHQIGYGVKPEYVVTFNDYVENLFDEYLYNFCQQYLNAHKAVQDCVMEAMSMYNVKPSRSHQRNWFQVPTYADALEAFAAKLKLDIEVDITYEALKKMEYRARKKFEDMGHKTFQEAPKVNDSVLSFDFH